MDCIHHWYLGSTNNGRVHAKCLKCNTEKDYPAFISFPPIKFKVKPKKCPKSIDDIIYSINYGYN
jgi:hypothetical protein